ncbi:hypothetical protein RGQ29_015605 [Quercus rubra]|uniref:WAT1-related protein n=1 Tax=Quercus rubra TaxID=3512 RepID=A0AAN7J4Z8_QUERU|nr:hypothetical protein RGQ29_015605 [Quercus rubra]
MWMRAVLLEEVVPFIAMVTMEGCTIGLTILAKTAMTNGMSPFVFVVYTNAIASIVLLFPYSFIFHCWDRSTILEWRSSSFQAKVIGSLISIMGAIMVELYKGTEMLKTSVSSPYILQFKQQLFIFSSTPEHWVLGGILLAATSLSVSTWSIIQLGTVKQYPELDVMKAVSFYSLMGTIQCTVFTLIVEKNLSAWKLKINMELLLIVLTSLGGAVRTRVHIWYMQIKGPFYVPMFKPVGIVFATIFGISFFANSLHYGR